MKAEPTPGTVLQTKWLVVLSMLAGVGLQSIEVSKWYLAVVKTAESIGGALFGLLQLIVSIGGSMSGFQLAMAFSSFLLVIGVFCLGFTKVFR